ncbi:hypothetical protein [Pseudotenacibaculum haliotis]|uniref:Bacteriocin n=1 Tax=Pseudotenacibaculum haliotis TaxID=1862138 RepID=A0ABW5LSU5_9FLAO
MKSLKQLGKILSKAEQKQVNGSGRPCQDQCPPVLSPGDYCRTGACQFGQCNAQMICEDFI